MSMHKFPAIAALLLLSCQSQANGACEDEEHFLFESTGRSVFFDLKNSDTGDGQSIDDAHFAGPLRSCSNSEVLCANGSFPIFYPASPKTKEWQIWHLNCSVTRNDPVERVSCTDGEKIAGIFEWRDQQLLKIQVRELNGDMTVYESSGCPLSASALQDWVDKQ